jgi:two-component system phosphate regulon response regulator PhoB
MPRTKILVVEDDRALADVLRYNLTQAGFDVACAADGREAVHLVRSLLPELVVLDVMIPLLDGIEVAKQIRKFTATQKTAILMLTAKGDEVDQVVGFSAGADDYVVKPFSVKVLMERVKALLRRQSDAADDLEGIVAASGVQLDRIKHRVTISGKPVNLTPSEFRLLETMIRQPGRAFDRAELMEAALGDDANTLERTIDVHIRALRKKMDAAGELIETVRGIGYRFFEPIPDAADSAAT